MAPIRERPPELTSDIPPAVLQCQYLHLKSIWVVRLGVSMFRFIQKSLSVVCGVDALCLIWVGQCKKGHARLSTPLVLLQRMIGNLNFGLGFLAYFANVDLLLRQMGARPGWIG